MHTSPDVLALVALGETAGTPAEQDHASTCPDCSKEVAELARIADVGRSATDRDTLVAPSPQVWERIRAELGLSGDLVADPSVAAHGRAPADHVEHTPATVTSLAARRGSTAATPPPRTSAGRRFLALAVAAALALVVGIGIGVTYQQRFAEPPTRVIARAELKPLPQWAGTTGRAEVTADGRGHRELILHVDPAKPVDGTLRVWLMKDSVRDPQAMGEVRNGEARITIPPGMSLFIFPVVDVSDEPPGDSDDQHSGDSVLRGELA